jgi:hypothetical protein
MVDGLHIRTKKPLVIALSGVERKLRERDNGSKANNIQNKSNQNCHNKSPLYNEYTLIKI